jgi:hypothetical protein
MDWLTTFKILRFVKSNCHTHEQQISHLVYSVYALTLDPLACKSIPDQLGHREPRTCVIDVATCNSVVCSGSVRLCHLIGRYARARQSAAVNPMKRSV